MLKSNLHIDNIVLILLIVTVLLFFVQGCGIYTVTQALNPPYAQQRDGNNYLRFTGNNTESYFDGYVLWYKGVDDTDYQVCEYQGEVKKPTIPKADVTPELPNIIYFSDLGHQIQLESFKELLDEGWEFEFAVSSYGTSGEESEKVKF